MEYRVLDTTADFEAAVDLEIAVWGLAPRDAVPGNLLRALTHGGGSLIGAYDGEKLIGVALGFPARSDDRWVFWSHMTGIQRGYQGQNVGFELKLFQRQWALAKGFTEIRWTFDPLQRGNANFNVHRLGATAEHYLVDFYGVMEDEINHAEVPSDRVEGVWRLNDPQVIKRICSDAADSQALDLPYALQNGNGIPVASVIAADEPEFLIGIPRNLRNLPDNVSAADWRIALRKALASAFARGYAAVDFTSADAYLLRRL